MSRLWVKICANTSLGDAQHAVRAGADAVGFVFATESKRRVTTEQVAAITPHLPATAEKFGVFVEQDVREIVETVRTAGLTGVQMHAPSVEHAAEYSALLREGLRDISRRLSIVQVLHFNAAERDNFVDELGLLVEGRAIDAVLIDSCVAGAAGGTGIVFDWGAAREDLLRVATQMRIIVAGGLTPTNVRQVVQTLNPWGVDVASGVETTAGVKDPHKVENFIAAARQTDAAATKTVTPTKA